MAHVQVPDITPRVVYAVGATPTSAFSIPFAFFDLAGDIRVFVGGAQATYTTTPTTSLQFSVTGLGAADDGYAGGTVTLGASVTNTTVIVERLVGIERTSDFPYPSATLNIRGLNTALDRVAAWAQELRRDLGRNLRLAPEDPTAGLTLPLVANRTGKALAFDSSGAIQMLTITGGTVTNYAQWAGTAGGTANARTLSPIPALGAYAAGVGLEFINGSAANTGPATLNVSGLGAVPWVRPDGAPLAAGDAPANALIMVRYDGTGFRMSNLLPAVAAASETGQGVIEIATQAETDAGTDDVRAITPLKVRRRKVAGLAQSSAYTVVVGDIGRTIRATGTWTLALPPAATAGDDFHVRIRNVGTGLITVDPDGSETVDGLTTVVVPPGWGPVLRCTGTEWFTEDFPVERLIRTQVLSSAVAFVDFTLPSPDILYRLDVVTGRSAAALMGLRTSTDGGITFASGATDYWRSTVYTTTTSPANLVNLASEMYLDVYTGTASATALQAVIDPGSASTPARLYAMGTSSPDGSGNLMTAAISGRRVANGAVNAIRILVLSGTLTVGGRFSLYGQRR